MGNFDDCQNLVKAMFNDEKFSSSINMSGVNSINWARIVAQAVYYFYAYFKIGNGQPLSFSVPDWKFWRYLCWLFSKETWIFQLINLL